MESILSRDGENEFLDSFEAFHRKIAYCGMCNSLSQTLLKIMSPGVPDFYQGTEIWNFSLVDPDNRRPVDYGERKKMLHDLKQWEKEAPRREIGRQLWDDVAGWKDQRCTSPIKPSISGKSCSRPEPDALYARWRRSGRDRHNVVRLCAAQPGSAVFVVAVPRLLMGLLNDGERPSLKEGVWDDSFLRLPTLPTSALRTFLPARRCKRRKAGRGRAPLRRPVPDLPRGPPARVGG